MRSIGRRISRTFLSLCSIWAIAARCGTTLSQSRNAVFRMFTMQTCANATRGSHFYLILSRERRVTTAHSTMSLEHQLQKSIGLQASKSKQRPCVQHVKNADIMVQCEWVRNVEACVQQVQANHSRKGNPKPSSGRIHLYLWSCAVRPRNWWLTGSMCLYVLRATREAILLGRVLWAYMYLLLLKWKHLPEARPLLTVCSLWQQRNHQEEEVIVISSCLCAFEVFL